jgi:hypothetical protein
MNDLKHKGNKLKMVKVSDFILTAEVTEYDNGNELLKTA